MTHQKLNAILVAIEPNERGCLIWTYTRLATDEYPRIALRAETKTSVAKRFEVSRRAVGMIVSGLRWKHVL